MVLIDWLCLAILVVPAAMGLVMCCCDGPDGGGSANSCCELTGVPSTLHVNFSHATILAPATGFDFWKGPDGDYTLMGGNSGGPAPITLECVLVDGVKRLRINFSCNGLGVQMLGGYVSCVVPHGTFSGTVSRTGGVVTCENLLTSLGSFDCTFCYGPGDLDNSDFEWTLTVELTA